MTALEREAAAAVLAVVRGMPRDVAAAAIGAAGRVVRDDATWTRGVRERAPSHDGKRPCPACSTRVGVRDIRPGMRLLVEHSTGRGRIVKGEPRCAGSAHNTSDPISSDGSAATTPPPSGLPSPRAVHLSHAQGAAAAIESIPLSPSPRPLRTYPRS